MAIYLGVASPRLSRHRQTRVERCACCLLPTPPSRCRDRGALLGVAPGGVYPCAVLPRHSVGSYPTISPLLFDSSLRQAQGKPMGLALSKAARPSRRAVCFCCTLRRTSSLERYTRVLTSLVLVSGPSPPVAGGRRYLPPPSVVKQPGVRTFLSLDSPA
jgi:hypothetical protein